MGKQEVDDLTAIMLSKNPTDVYPKYLRLKDILAGIGEVPVVTCTEEVAKAFSIPKEAVSVVPPAPKAAKHVKKKAAPEVGEQKTWEGQACFTMTSKDVKLFIKLVKRMGAPLYSIESNVHIDVKDGKATIEMTNNTTWVRRVLPGAIGTGSICVNFKRFSTMFNGADSLVSFGTDGKRLNIHWGDVDNYMSGWSDQIDGNYPQFPVLTDERRFDIGVERLARAVEFSAYDTFKPVLRGVYVKKDVLVATDGKRLIVDDSVPIDMNDETGIIIPQEVIEIASVFKGESVELAYDTARFELRTGNYTAEYTIGGVLVEGRYPKYQQVIPNDSQYSVIVKRSDLISVIDKVKRCAPKSNRIDIFFKDGQATFRAMNDDSETSGIIPYTGSIDDVSFGFNYKFLLSVTSACEAEELRIALTDQNVPAKITPPGYDLLFLVMPMGNVQGEEIVVPKYQGVA